MSNINEIENLDIEQLAVFSKLSEGQLLNRDNPKDGLFIAESPKVIERALDAGYEPITILMEKRHIAGEGKGILKRIGDVPIFVSEFDVLTQITGFELTRGMLCAMKRKSLPELTSILEKSSRIAVLENVMNPTNVGAIFRSAAALGIDAVILTKGSSNPLYRRAIRVSMGTVFQIPWTITEDENWVETLKDHGYLTASMALSDDSISIDNPLLKSADKLALILGTEGDGLSKTTIASTDYVVKIPMAESVDSLNVAAASAVAFWEITKLKGEKDER